MAEVAEQLGVTGQTIYNWRNQDLVEICADGRMLSNRLELTVTGPRD